MAVDFAAAIEITGLDLSDVEKFQQDIAGEYTSRWAAATFGEFKDKAKAALLSSVNQLVDVGPIKNTLAGLTPALGVLKSWKAVQEAMGEELKAAQAANIRRVWAARDKAIEETYRPGDWWTLAKVEGPAEVQLKKPYGESQAAFTSQYTPPGIVFSAARAAGKDVLFPSFPSSPGSPSLRFYAWGGELGLAADMPALAVKTTDAPTCGELNWNTCSVEVEGWKVWRWLHGLVCVPLDLTAGCGLPGLSWWSYCLGCAPQWGWLGQEFPLGPLGTTLAAAINSPTPYHLAIKEETVRASLHSILKRCRVLELDEDPGQTEDGVFREAGGIGLKLRGILGGDDGFSAKYWMPNTPQTPAPMIFGQELAEIIERHRTWLALRRAILLTLPGLSPAIVAAAKESPDPAVREAAKGNPPKGPWSLKDPLGLFPTQGGGVSGPKNEGGIKGPGGMGPGTFDLDAGESANADQGGAAGAVLLGLTALGVGGGFAVRHLLKRGKGKGKSKSRKRRRGRRRG